jgi:hypothetical protein
MPDAEDETDDERAVRKMCTHEEGETKEGGKAMSVRSDERPYAYHTLLLNSHGDIHDRGEHG